MKSIQPLPQINQSLPFLIGLVIFGVIMWVVFLVLKYPDDGIRALSASHQVLAVDEQRPGGNPLQVGDILLEVDGQLLSGQSAWYWGKRPGDYVRFRIQRGEKILSVALQLSTPQPLELFRRLIPLSVALVFLFIALAVEAFAPRSPTTKMFFGFFVASSLLLTSGQASGLGPVIVLDLYYFLWWMVGPISVHFHLYFPQQRSSPQIKGGLILLYGIGLLGGLFHLGMGTTRLHEHAYFSLLIPISRLFLALCMLLNICLLYYNYRTTISPAAKAKIRLILLGGVLAATPLVTTYLVPEVLLNRPFLPASAIFLFLCSLPLVYGYGVFRYRLIEIEHHINRGVTLLLVVFILVGIYSGVFSLVTRFLPRQYLFDPALNTLIILLLAATILPISRRVQRFVDTLFYGGWYDYRSAILQITSGLEQVNDLSTLAREVTKRLVKTLRVADACIFLSDIYGDLSVVAVAPEEAADQANGKMDRAVLPRSSLEFLLKVGEEERETIAKALAQAKLSPQEFQLLRSPQAYLWVPILSHQQVKGLIALGPKYGGDVFSAEDMDILRVVSRNLGPIIENIHLLNQLRQYAADLELRVQERTSELFEAKRRVEAILASVGDGVVVTNLRGEIELTNQAMEIQTSYTQEEILQRNYFDWLALSNSVATIEAIQISLSRGDVWNGELVHQRKNGELYDILVTIAPVRDQSGEIINYVATQRDITYRKELERLKDIFVADVSHELRTPITNIALYLELLETAPEYKREEYIQVLKEQSRLLRRLIEDILDLSRLAIGKTRKIEFEPVDLNLLIEQAVIAYTPAVEKAGLKLLLETVPSAKVRGELHYLSRALQNLLGNAIQYTPKGWVRITSRRDGEWVCLEVQDSGIGIPEEDLPHIFERFYRGKLVRQSKVPGTGLGLAIVKEIVELHNGQIEVESEVGRGSVFRIYLPAWIDGDR
ncbi:MAG: ATP-binding protein [Anaerolineales bacterium]|nr:ATP-binding protein [Anaerolineales bacterium]MDW8162332.1 ATP-binding protein [Anaerolineales bacterium]